MDESTRLVKNKIPEPEQLYHSKTEVPVIDPIVNVEEHPNSDKNPSPNYQY